MLVVSPPVPVETPKVHPFNSIVPYAPLAVLNGDKLWISVANPAVNKYGEGPRVVYGIFIIGPGRRYAIRVDPNINDKKTIIITIGFIYRII